MIGYEIGFVVCVRERVTYYYLYPTIVSSYIISQLEISYFSCLRMSSLRKEGTTLHKIFTCGSKINILPPPPPPPFFLPKTLQADPRNSKNEKFIKSFLVWLSQEYQEKPLAKHLDNLQIRTIRKIYKTIHISR